MSGLSAMADSLPLHILVVDDDERLRALLKEYLTGEGYIVTAAKSAKDARKKMEMFIFDLMVLDVMMPGEDGVTFAAALRPQLTTPILMLTAMGESEDRIRGLESGADDYLTKPFEPRELALRIKKLLQRSVREVSTAATVRFGNFIFDLNQQSLLQDGEPVYLTTGEVSLLMTLAVHPGEPVNRAALAEALGIDAENERGVDVQVTRLRKKIEPDTGRPVYLQTVRGEGYVLRSV